jgi:serine protease Do
VAREAPASSTDTDCDERAAVVRVLASVAHVSVETNDRARSGTAFVVDDGLLITNAHVVDGAHSVHLTLSTGVTVAGTVTAADSAVDLALIVGPTYGLSPVEWKSASSLRSGQRLIAAGFPLDDEPTVTSGSFSELRSSHGSEYVHTDTPISRGNSGGPLFTACGAVVGVVMGWFEGGAGLSVAIPSDVAREAMVEMPPPPEHPPAAPAIASGEAER